MGTALRILSTIAAIGGVIIAIPDAKEKWEKAFWGNKNKKKKK